jgi:hypothetical protein
MLRGEGMRDESDIMAGVAELEPEAKPAPTPTPPAAAKAAPAADRDADTPWCDFNARHTVQDVLRAAGWTYSHTAGENEHWTRQGKQSGTSGTVKDGCFYCFTSSTEFEAGRGYDAWGAHVALHHGGDFKTAAREYRREHMPATGTREAPAAEDSNALTFEGWPEIVDGTETLERPLERPAELIEGVCFVNSKITLSAPSKSRKTWTLLHAGLCVATGTPWLGRKVMQGRVLYVNLELCRYSFSSRKAQILRSMGEALLAGQFDELHLRGHCATVEQLQSYARNVLAGRQYALLIVDPIYKILGNRSENDSSEMADLMNKLENIAHTAGAALLVCHHFAKGNASAKESIDRAAGSGVVGRDGDALLTLTPHEEEDCMTLECTLRDMAPQPPVVLRWTPPTWQSAEDLDPARLKQPAKPALREVTEADVCDALGRENLTRAELVAKLQAATKRGEKCCRDAVNAAQRAGKLGELTTPRRGTNAEIRFFWKGA